jgi:hypothetical protein
VGQWWGGWILDVRARRGAYVGSLAVDPSRTLVGDAVDHTAYFGGATACAEGPRSAALWSAPAGDGHGDDVGAYAVSARFRAGDAPGCNARVEANG